MSDDSLKVAIAAMKSKKERLLAEAAAEIDRAIAADMADLERLAAVASKYNISLVGPDNKPFPWANTDVSPDIAISANDTVILVEAKSAAPVEVMTVAALIDLYRTHERSPYHRLRHSVRDNYDNMIGRIALAIGPKTLDALNADNIQQLHKEWSGGDGSKLALSHSMVTKLRLLFSFGTTVLNDAACQRLSIIMNQLRFPTPTARSESLTAEQVFAIRAKAHEMGYASIALAQALQFELGLRQKDVIGEWVPATEPGESALPPIDSNKWLYGICWEEIGEDLILRHESSFRKKPVVRQLSDAETPMVMQEIRKRYADIPKSGPVIVAERKGIPWTSAEFRRKWRKVASAAGVPPDVKNMDSRPMEMRSVTTKNAIAIKEGRLVH